ncbi:hypothetical protein NL533_32865, partial [Klebsiella pneumoniae]|nr:hypothetical protein [Klebsiella pneumoniae]
MGEEYVSQVDKKYIGKWMHVWKGPGERGLEHHPRFFVWGVDDAPENFLTVRIEDRTKYNEPILGKMHVHV